MTAVTKVSTMCGKKSIRALFPIQEWQLVEAPAAVLIESCYGVDLELYGSR